MKLPVIVLLCWVTSQATHADEQLNLTPIVIPEPPEEPSEYGLEEESVEMTKKRERVGKMVEAAFSDEGATANIFSLEPNHPRFLKSVRPQQVAKLRPETLHGYRYYGSVELNKAEKKSMADAIVSAILTPRVPSLGFCWSPRHALVVKRPKKPDMVVVICYECGGMKIPHGDDLFTCVRPIGMDILMNKLFDRHKIPLSKPLAK